MDATQARACLGGAPEDDRQRRVERAQQTAERIGAERRVSIHARGDEGMRDLQEEGGRAAEQEERLAIDAPRDGVRREDPVIGHTPSVALLRSFSYAFAGLGHLIRTQRNFRIELAIGAVAIVAGLVARFERWEWAALVLTIAVVLVLEGLNTAIENAATLASPAPDPRAKAAKDVSAAAVLIAAAASVVVGVLLFGPRLLGH